MVEPDWILFADGSCLRNDQGVLKASYAVCTLEGVVEASSLCNVSSTQVADLVALTRTCSVFQRKKVTIYMDSQYGFGVVHDFGQLSSQKGFMTSSGTPINFALV